MGIEFGYLFATVECYPKLDDTENKLTGVTVRAHGEAAVILAHVTNIMKSTFVTSIVECRGCSETWKQRAAFSRLAKLAAICANLRRGRLPSTALLE